MSTGAVMRHHEPETVAVVTAPGGRDGHQHCAIVDEEGNGYTSPAADGHFHDISELVVMSSGSTWKGGNRRSDLAPQTHDHAHELSARRCSAQHGTIGQHVAPK